MTFSRIIVALCFLASTAGAQAATCINTNDVENSDAPDGKSIVLKMKDGKVWHVALKGTCPNIRMYGFSWNVEGGQVCDNSQMVHVLHSGEICSIAKFEPGDLPKHN